MKTTAESWYGNSGTPPPVALEVEVCADVEVVALLAVEDEDDAAVAVDEELSGVVVVEVLEPDDDKAESGITERLESPLLATKTSPFAESYATSYGSFATVTFATILLLLSDTAVTVFDM